ncbi:MAG: nucleotide exchange factor GrpE [Solirubrobacterales bacterium]
MRPDRDDPGADERGTKPSAAGPVGAGDPPPPAVAKASSGVGPPTPPPAGGASTDSAEGPGPAGPRSEGSSEGERVERDFDALLADAQKEKDEYLELAKRTQADFENFRKRMAAEVTAAGVRGKGQLAQEVVPALDDLERAIEAAGLDPEGDSEDGLAHGVLLVFRSLREGLKRNGIEVVDPQGEKFDPNQHEALSTVPVEEAESGTVVEVLQKGYRLNEQLLRPARVVVSE